MRLTASVLGFLLVFSFSLWAGSFHVTVDGTAVGDGSHCFIMGLYIQSGIENRASAQAGSSPEDVNITDGVYFTENNNKLINFGVENNGGNCIGFWNSAVDSEM